MTLQLTDATTGFSRISVPICVLTDRVGDPTLHRLEADGYAVVGARCPSEAVQKVQKNGCRVLLTDFQLRGAESFAFLNNVRKSLPEINVIVITNSYSTDYAIEAIRHGAYDCLGRPLDYTYLERTIGDLEKLFARRAEIRGVEEQMSRMMEFEGMAGKSPVMSDLFDWVRRASRHYRTALITGPAGSGKSVIAQALQRLSPVARALYAVCDCSLLTDSELESEIFGHPRCENGHPSGARPGLMEYASEGTILLDEIGAMALPIQVKLLGVIKTREIRRVGSGQVVKVKCRIIATTRRDLGTEVSEGRFLGELLDCLGGVEIRVPALIARSMDIPILVQHFWKKSGRGHGKSFRGLSQQACVLLLEHDWPENVRELENVVSSAAMVSAGDFIDAGDLPGYLKQKLSRQPASLEKWQPLPLEQIRESHIQRVLESCHGNRMRASKMLGIGRTSLYRFLKRSSRQDASFHSRI